MTDEEKKIVEKFKEFCFGEGWLSFSVENGKTILNIIEKQQKEIEELKQDRDKFKKALGKKITYCNELEKDLFENCSNYVIPKSKVQDKMEEIKKRANEGTKNIENVMFYQGYYIALEKLLEEE